MTHRATAPTAHVATDIDPTTTQPAYWYAQSPVASVPAFNFDRLWKACEAVARDYHFALDREDYREGVLTTEPMVSKQLWEVWRGDAGTSRQALESSLATVRRTLRFEVHKEDDGTFVMTPKVLVERQTTVTRRVTTVYEYRWALAGTVGGRHSDIDTEISGPAVYWTAIGRDEAMERQIAKAVKRKVNG